MNNRHLPPTTHRAKNTPVTMLVLGLLVCMLASGCYHSPKRTMQVGQPQTRQKAGTRPYTIQGKTYYPLTHAHGFKQTGLASWYGKDFHGKQTANGERYDMFGMTAAHKELPFNTHVRVTNKKNGRSIIVRVNDRGPFVDGRIIDLTHTAAHHLGMLGPGTAPVHIEALHTTPPPANIATRGQQPGKESVFFIQLGAFGQRDNAERLARRIQTQGTAAKASFDSSASLWRVHAGPFASLERANHAAGKFQREYPNSFVITE